MGIPIPVRRYLHYNDVIMSTMASQVTSLAIVYSAVYSGTVEKTSNLCVTGLCARRIHRWPVNYPHKGSVTRKCNHFMTSSCFYSITPAVGAQVSEHVMRLLNIRSHRISKLSLWFIFDRSFVRFASSIAWSLSTFRMKQWFKSQTRCHIAFRQLSIQWNHQTTIYKSCSNFQRGFLLKWGTVTWNNRLLPCFPQMIFIFRNIAIQHWYISWYDVIKRRLNMHY